MSLQTIKSQIKRDTFAWPQLISHIREATCYTTARISGVYYMEGRFSVLLWDIIWKTVLDGRGTCSLSLQLRQKTLNQGEDSGSNQRQLGRMWLNTGICLLSHILLRREIPNKTTWRTEGKSSITKMGLNGVIVLVMGIQRRWL